MIRFIGACVLIIFVSSPLFSQDVQPPAVSTPPGQAPSDAIALFDGSGLSSWNKQDGTQPHWTVDGGELIVRPGGGLVTTDKFGDFQLHVEFASPNPVAGNGQERGNSGVYLHGCYELQVLDSFANETYTDGMAGAIYQQYAPLVNASRPPGAWQAYDIIFHAPRFNIFGHVIVRARITVLYNNVLIQDNVEINPTPGGIRETEDPTGPIFLQDHSNPVKYRNIWIREL